jgi:chromosome partitioning protein
LYDFIIIDLLPSLGRLLINALVASDFVLIPTETSPFAAQGITTLNNTIEYVRNGFNPSLTIIGILLIKFNSRTVLSRDLRQAIKEYAKTINTSVFDASIRNGISVQESQTVRQPLIDYAKNSKPNLDYMAFTDELLRRIGG